MASTRHTNSQAPFTVTEASLANTTHLKAAASEVNEKIRTEQAKELGNILQTMSSDSALDVDASFRENGSVPIFLLGDFNSEANGEGQTTVRSIIERNEKPHFQSAYPLDHPYSTWKTRGKVKTKRVIDYIFHNSQDIRGVHCTHILGLPEEERWSRTVCQGSVIHLII